jgi:hypothetical protein
LQPERHEEEVNRVVNATVSYLLSSQRQAFLITPTSIPRNLTVGTGTYVRTNGDVSMSSSLYQATVTQAESQVRSAFGDDIHHIIPLALGGSHHLQNLLRLQGKRSEDLRASAHAGLHNVLDEAGEAIELYLRNASGGPVRVQIDSLDEAKLRRAIQQAGQMNVVIGTLFRNGEIVYRETEIVFDK